MNATTRRVADSVVVPCVAESNTERSVGFVTEKTPRVNVTRCRNGTESGVSSVMVRLLCDMVVEDGRQRHHQTARRNLMWCGVVHYGSLWFMAQHEQHALMHRQVSPSGTPLLHHEQPRSALQYLARTGEPPASRAEDWRSLRRSL